MSFFVCVNVELIPSQHIAVPLFYDMIGMKDDTLTLWLAQAYLNAVIWLVPDTYPNVAIWLLRAV